MSGRRGAAPAPFSACPTHRPRRPVHAVAAGGGFPTRKCQNRLLGRQQSGMGFCTFPSGGRGQPWMSMTLSAHPPTFLVTATPPDQPPAALTNQSCRHPHTNPQPTHFTVALRPSGDGALRRRRGETAVKSGGVGSRVPRLSRGQGDFFVLVVIGVSIHSTTIIATVTTVTIVYCYRHSRLLEYTSNRKSSYMVTDPRLP